MKDDFTAEWRESNGEILDFRITKGKELYTLPWYRRILMRLIGSSHIFRRKWTHIIIDTRQLPPSTPPDKP
jgi:hypothetical protein